MPRNLRSSAPLAALSLVILLVACGSSSPTDPLSGTIEVELREASFSRPDLTIEVGSTIRWVNQGNVTHTITPDGHGEWQRQELSQADEVFEHTFTSEGTFDYFCEPHQAVGMTGTIRVVQP